MNLKNVIVHEIIKEPGETNAEHNLRENENPVNELSNSLVESLASLFGKTGLSFGEFGLINGEMSSFQTKLEEVIGEEENTDKISDGFLALTRDATRYLTNIMGNSTQAKGGYLLFYLYEYQDSLYLNIILLRNTQGMTLSSDLSLSEIDRLDLDKLHMAGSIDIKSWLSGNKAKYICFKKSSQAVNVTQYFTNFIGVKEYETTAKDTTKLIKAVLRYCEEQNYLAEKVEAIRQVALTHCKEVFDNEEPLILEEFSKIIDPLNPEAFLELAQGEDFELTNEIFLDKRTLRKFVRIKIKQSSLNLAFDTSLLFTNDFSYDENNKWLTITVKNLNEQTIEEIETSMKAEDVEGD